MTTDRDKARAGYERALPHMRFIQIQWKDLPQSVVNEWVAKVPDIEADPNRWLLSDDPSCVLFAQGVLGHREITVRASLMGRRAELYAATVEDSNRQIERALLGDGRVTERGQK